jgi:hypothetical protein
MIKILGVFVAGMFVGAVCVEVLARTRPELLDTIAGGAEGASDMFIRKESGENETEAVSC